MPRVTIKNRIIIFIIKLQKDAVYRHDPKRTNHTIKDLEKMNVLDLQDIVEWYIWEEK